MENVDYSILILGASTISAKAYEELADNINRSMITGGAYSPLIVTPANNPNHTKKFVENVHGDPDADLKIYERALRNIDIAELVIVDISSASTGMGMEVGYLLSKYPQKYVVFIAKEGSKISPHIAGLYKHSTGKEIKVHFYEDESRMTMAVKKSIEYGSYEIDQNY